MSLQEELRNEPAAAGLLKVVEDSGLEECLAEIQREFFDPSLYSLHTLSVRLSGFIKTRYEMEERDFAALTKAAIEPDQSRGAGLGKKNCSPFF